MRSPTNRRRHDLYQQDDSRAQLKVHPFSILIDRRATIALAFTAIDSRREMLADTGLPREAVSRQPDEQDKSGSVH